MNKQTRTKLPEGTTQVRNSSTGEVKQVGRMSDKYVVPVGDILFIRCWSCEILLRDSQIHDNDGDCPDCNVEICLSDDPYVEPLTELEKGNE